VERAAHIKLQQLLLSKQLLQTAKAAALRAFDREGFLAAAKELGHESQVLQLFEVSPLPDPFSASRHLGFGKRCLTCALS
jgi:hypothetical protein